MGSKIKVAPDHLRCRAVLDTRIGERGRPGEPRRCLRVGKYDGYCGTHRAANRAAARKAAAARPGVDQARPVLDALAAAGVPALFEFGAVVVEQRHWDRLQRLVESAPRGVGW